MADAIRTTLSMLGASQGETFMGVPAVTDATDVTADIALFGAPCCTPYLSAADYANANLDGPRAIRQALATWAWAHDRYDWDQGECLYVDMDERTVDLGDLALQMDCAERTRALIQSTCEQILSNNAVPFALGGDDSIPLPMLWAMQALDNVTILQLDVNSSWGLISCQARVLAH